ncbi:VTC domain-containing protein [Planctomycetota bacterium]
MAPAPVKSDIIGQKVRTEILRPQDSEKDRVLGCRHELKYLVSEAQTVAISQFLAPHLAVDRYSKLQPQGYYPIVSLYLDSLDLRLARETLEREKNRFKLRIRSYSDDLEYPVFVEIKRRINRIILKSRTRIRHQDIPAVISGRALVHQDARMDLKTLNQFQLYTQTLRANPVMLVRYLRKAYEGGTESRIRVTFDRDLSYKKTNTTDITLGGSGWQRNTLSQHGTILEIKFTGTYPHWLSEMTACFGLQARGVSKYASSIQQSTASGFCVPRVGA